MDEIKGFLNLAVKNQVPIPKGKGLAHNLGCGIFFGIALFLGSVGIGAFILIAILTAIMNSTM